MSWTITTRIAVDGPLASKITKGKRGEMMLKLLSDWFHQILQKLFSSYFYAFNIQVALKSLAIYSTRQKGIQINIFLFWETSHSEVKVMSHDSFKVIY